MEHAKLWYQSKTIWGGLIAVLAAAARLAGLEIGADIQAELVDAAMTLAGAIGGLLAIYGRLAATKPILGGDER
ncbi:hypothetical protein [Rhizobium sp. RU36D]|uniref:hypothetical protein n=1 Tax=Rhizobium sp. RU36D TaxID=1907415 RepID=UPI0009D7CE41|nr:hypothetical protein [Rhizobium sp. RU36D]SMD10937.1 hypothetical protein SAMN05880593_12237 [Rhizobium sp. RU36D]